jgi:multiple sugar transport system permease protein
MRASLSIVEERRRIQKTFMIPLITTLLVMIIVPLASLFVFSLTSVQVGFKNFRFIGFLNYEMLFEDPDFWTAFSNTLIMMAGIVVTQMVVGVAYAILIYKTRVLSGFIRVVMMFPMVVSPIIVGILWRILLMPKYGGFNILLSALGVSDIPDWFGSVYLAKLVIIFAASWEWTPFVILYVLAGLEGLPSSPFESARIDGANWLQEIFLIMLPMLKKLLVTVTLFRVIESFKIFPLIYSITTGGPGNATEDLTYMIYKNGFKYLKLGYSSAVSMIILAMILVFIVALGLINRKKRA